MTCHTSHYQIIKSILFSNFLCMFFFLILLLLDHHFLLHLADDVIFVYCFPHLEARISRKRRSSLTPLPTRVRYHMLLMGCSRTRSLFHWSVGMLFECAILQRTNLSIFHTTELLDSFLCGYTVLISLPTIQYALALRLRIFFYFIQLVNELRVRKIRLHGT